MGDYAQPVISFISTNGIYAVGIAALLAYVSEIYSGLTRSGPPTAWSNVKLLTRFAVTALSVAAAIFLFSTLYERKTPVALAAQNVIETYHSCLDAAAGLSPAATVEIDGSPRPIALQCLAYAIDRDGPDHNASTPARALAEDEELGNRLLADSATKNPVAKTLQTYFGIKRSTFLGTGYSVPRGTEETPGLYSEAKIREYLVQNYCAEQTAYCKARKETVWAWTVDAHRFNDLVVRDVIESTQPHQGGAAFARWYKQIARTGKTPDDVPVLVRFSKFPLKFYKGTVGRPEAAYVFFSDFDQTLDLHLREALRRSGSTTKELDELEGQTVFIWIAVPDDNGDFMKLATWSNVFLLLKEMNVDSRLAAVADAAPQPFLRRFAQQQSQ